MTSIKYLPASSWKTFDHPNVFFSSWWCHLVAHNTEVVILIDPLMQNSSRRHHLNQHRGFSWNIHLNCFKLKTFSARRQHKVSSNLESTTQAQLQQPSSVCRVLGCQAGDQCLMLTVSSALVLRFLGVAVTQLVKQSFMNCRMTSDSSWPHAIVSLDKTLNPKRLVP